MLPSLEPELRLVEQHLVSGRDPSALQLEYDSPGALGRLELELKPATVATRAPNALHLGQLFCPGLRLAGTCSGSEPGDEPLESFDLRLLALDRPAQRQLALCLLLAPGVPGTGEEAAAAALELEHARPNGLQKPAIVGHQDDCRVEGLKRLLEPLERRHVEMVGRLVEQQQVGIAGEGASQRRPRELSSRECLKRPVQVTLVSEPEAPQRVQGPVPPCVAARVLEPGLCVGVATHGPLVVGSARHRLLERLQLLFDCDQVPRAGQHVVAQRQLPFARGPLIVQRHTRPFSQNAFPAVE